MSRWCLLSSRALYLRKRSRTFFRGDIFQTRVFEEGEGLTARHGIVTQALLYWCIGLQARALRKQPFADGCVSKH